MIRIGILGYGNLGRGVELAMQHNDDMELVAIFTRRDPKSYFRCSSGRLCRYPRHGRLVQ